MKIDNVKFVKSSPSIDLCPKDDRPEYAFIGRSNVGKSSLINMLTNNRKLAKTSSTPGKTQLINHFDVDGKWYLVDLPGYGYAKVSKTDRAKWEKMINRYLRNRRTLACLFILVDSRHEPQKIDLDFVNRMGEEGVPFVIVLTKSDKVNARDLGVNQEQLKEKLLESWEALPNIMVSSGVKKTGKKEILAFIEQTNTEIAD